MILENQSLVRQAYERGKDAAYHGFLRVSPFYEERVFIRGKRVDITPMLNEFWYLGFDGKQYPDKPDALDTKTDPLPAQQGQPINA